MKKFVYLLALTCFAFFQSCEKCKTCEPVVVIADYDSEIYDIIAESMGYESYENYLEE
jgi:hypothetical protein